MYGKTIAGLKFGESILNYQALFAKSGQFSYSCYNDLVLMFQTFIQT